MIFLVYNYFMKKMVVGGLLLILILAVGVWYFTSQKMVSPLPTQPDIRVIFPEEKEKPTVKPEKAATEVGEKVEPTEAEKKE